MIMTRATSPRTTLIAALLAVGCGAPVPGAAPDPDLRATSGALVNAGRAVTPFGGPTARETVTVVSSTTGHKVIAFNYTDPAHVTSGGTVSRGASIMGWSWSGGPGINDAFAPPQRVAPPAAASCAPQPWDPDPCWPVLWGDPGLGEVAGTSLMFMTSLAVPDRRMPASGQIPDYLLGTVLGGGCVARSSDGGATFTIASADCLHDEGYSAYDGSDVTGTVPGGPVFAAFVNVVHKTIDVWMAPTPTAPFTKLPNPFPNLAMREHPRLRWMSITGILLLLAGDESGRLWLQEYSGGWGNVSASWPKLVGSDYDTTGSVSIGSTSLRVTAQYDLMGTQTYAGDTRVIVLYATKPSAHTVLKEASCNPYSPVQSPCVGGATIDRGVNVFHPAVAVANITNPGSGQTWSTVWQAAWSQQSGNAKSPGNQVAIFSGLLGAGSVALTGRRETGFGTPCPTNGNFWGDYNTRLGVYQAAPTSYPLFWTAFSDSTDPSGASGCNADGPINVSASWINYPGTKFDAGEFMDQDYNFSGIDWDFLYFKGQCLGEFALQGLSMQPGTGLAHGILCQMSSPTQFPGDPVATLVLPYDQRRAFRNGDWDWGYYKLECGANEYVAGVSQNYLDHSVHAVRCARSPVLQDAACFPRFFTSSGLAGDGDWDYGFFKAECTASEYVAGVSVDPGTLNLHAILCCSR
jgi:hypothetical protein